MSDDTDQGEGGPTSVWSVKTITGGIAAVGTLLAAVAALINSTSALRPKQAAPAAPSALVGSAPLPAPAAPVNPAQREFEIGMMSDGFAWVRKDRSVASPGLIKLPSGTHVVCGNRVGDLDPRSPSRWRFCAERDGYVNARLLVPLDNR
jgi:hypothetical protein